MKKENEKRKMVRNNQNEKTTKSTFTNKENKTQQHSTYL